MAQDPDSVTGGAVSDRDASTDTYTPDEQRSPADIERDIERTRAEMSETVDAITARFQPEYIKEQAKEAIRDTARSAGTSMFDTIRDNPLPAAIAGMSIAWLFAHASSGDRRRDDRYGPSYGYGGYRERDARGYGPGPGYDRYGATGGYGGASSGNEASLADRASSAATDVRDRAQDALGTVRDRTQDLGQSVAEGAQHVGEQVGQAGQRAVTWLEDQMDRNPLGVGAVALAAGALVGLSLPSTAAEQTLFGEPAQQFKSRVEEAASETLDKAKDVASTVADEAKQKAGEVVEAAKEKASEVADSAKDKAQDVAATAESEARGLASGGSGSGGSSSGAPASAASSSGTSGNPTNPSEEHVANVNDPEPNASSDQTA